MIELNLLPDVKLEFVHAQKARRRVISVVSIGSIVAVGLVVVFAMYVYVVQPVYGAYIDGGIKDANKQLLAKGNLNNYLTIQQQLKDLPGLHNAKPMYSRIIGYLPILNPSAPNNVRIVQLVIDPSNQVNGIVIQAYAPSYTAATVFEQTLKSAQFAYSTGGAVQSPIPLFTDVQLSDTSLGEDSNGAKVVNFKLTLTVDPTVFAFSSTNTSITVPSKNATKSAQDVPVFADTRAGGAQ